MTLATLRAAHRDARFRGPAAHRRAARGQSMVELALILPLLLLLVVVALDFGRIYLGYINVQNMARIAANHAANNPEAWTVTPDSMIQARYRNQILEDTSASNCELPEDGSGNAVIPSPVFTDRNGDGTAVGLGDQVTVQITCSFGVATPIIGNILGDSVPVTAESNFPVKAGVTAVLDEGVSGGGGGGGSVTAPPTSGFVANSSVFATPDEPGTLTLVGPDVVADFRDTSGGGFAMSWDWDFGDGAGSADQDVAHRFTCPTPDASGYCTFLVTFTAANAYGTSEPAYMVVYVLGESETNFSSDVQVIDAGQSVQFTDQSSLAGVTYEWSFGDGQSAIGPDSTVSHAYAASGTYSVTLTVAYPDPIPAGSVTKTGYITVNVGLCTVPSLLETRFNAAVPVYEATFDGTVQRGVGANSGNFTIKSQSLTGGIQVPCDSDIYVSNLSWVDAP